MADEKKLIEVAVLIAHKGPEVQITVMIPLDSGLSKEEAAKASDEISRVIATEMGLTSAPSNN